MDHYLTTFDNLEDELAEPCTKILRLDSNVEYDSLLRQQLNMLVSKDKKESEENYRQSEDAFCESQLKKLKSSLLNNKELDKSKTKSALPNNTEEENGVGYAADFEQSDTDDNDLFLENADRKLHKRQKIKKTKRSRKAKTHRLGYSSQRIERREPDALQAKNQAQRVTSDAHIDECVAFGEEAKLMNDRMYELYAHPQPDYFLYSNAPERSDFYNYL